MMPRPPQPPRANRVKKCTSVTFLITAKSLNPVHSAAHEAGFLRFFFLRIKKAAIAGRSPHCIIVWAKKGPLCSLTPHVKQNQG